MDALIDSAQTDLANRSSQGQDGLKNALAGIQERIDRLDVFFALLEGIDTKQSELQKARIQLSETLAEKCLVLE